MPRDQITPRRDSPTALTYFDLLLWLLYFAIVSVLAGNLGRP